MPIIEKQVQAGSTIYSDAWSAYFAMNELWYHHFTERQKYPFKKVYIDEDNRRKVLINKSYWGGLEARQRPLSKNVRH